MNNFHTEDMKPEGIPEDIIKQAEVVHAQLLIHTHTLSIIQKTLHVYMIGSDIWIMQVGKHKLESNKTACFCVKNILLFTRTISGSYTISFQEYKLEV